MELSEINLRLTHFAGMLFCCHKLYLWEFDPGFHLIRSNCPHEEVVSNLFTILRGGSLSESLSTAEDTPILLSNDVEMLWVTQPRIEDGEVTRLYVLGPLFLDAVSPANIAGQLGGLALSVQMRAAAQEFVRELPVISLSRVYEYAIMLHYCVTDKRISVSDMRYDRGRLSATYSREETSRSDAHGTYELEREMVRMVREGDIANYRAQMDRLSTTGAMGKLSNGDPLRQMKNAVITCLVLYSRAAMEGGLDPELSYSLSDRYFQSIEACGSISDLVEIAIPMQEDYIQRVSDIKRRGLSKQIQSLCDYIDLHLEEHIDLPTLARRSGYAEYYLSRKFKSETGLPPSDYVRKKRLERAAHLLRYGSDDVQQIAERLQFSSQSHFAESFRKEYDMTPSAYRASNK